MQTIRIANTADIPEGQMKGFTIEDKKVLVANVGGKYYAIDAVCSHIGGYLPSGKLQNNVVTCPKHGTQFDVKTGKVYKQLNVLYRVATMHNASDLNRYDVVVEGDDIKVQI